MSLAANSAKPFLQPTVINRKYSESKSSKSSESDQVSLRVDRFLPPSAANRFAVRGDAGTGKRGQFDVANQLSKWWEALPFDSVLELGDNVYKHGEPKDFEDRILKPNQVLLGRGVKYKPILGNHDVKYGFAKEQLAFWAKLDPSSGGKQPAYYNFKKGPEGAEVEFWALDTTVLLPGDYGCHKKNVAEAQEEAKKQMAWLKESLAQSTAPMKVVYGHYPLYSLGAHSEEKRMKIQTKLEGKLAPLFKKYGVDVYMAGHEHHYEKPKVVDGVHYLVSGAGGEVEAPSEGVAEGNGVMKQLHFMLFDITPKGLIYRTISDQGKLIDSGLIPKKEKIRPEAQPAVLTLYQQTRNCLGALAQAVADCFSGLSAYWPSRQAKKHTPEEMV